MRELTPVYEDDLAALYCGDFREILPALGVTPTLVVADPPYGETSLGWDRWPGGWPAAVAASGARSMWCFGSMRMFLDRRDEFDGWRMSQDVVWEKHNGSGFAKDRFKRVHEHALHFYRGDWADVYHEVPTQPGEARPSATIRGRQQPTHTGVIGNSTYEYGDTRIMRSVIYARSMHGTAINETEKPIPILEPLIAYGCPGGGLVVDVFAGSCSTLVAARALGIRSIGIELRPEQCEKAARRLGQGCLDLSGVM